MMMVHPDQADPNCKQSRINCRECTQLPLDVDGLDSKIDTKMLKPPHDILFYLEVLDNGR